MIISIDTETVFGKIQHTFIIQTWNKLGLEENTFNLIKEIHKTHTANILNEEKVNAFSLRSGTRQDVCSHNFYNVESEVLVKQDSLAKKNKIKCMQIIKK